MDNKTTEQVDPQELWDEFSEYLGESVYDAERLVGQSVLTKPAFDKLIAKLASTSSPDTGKGLRWVKASDRPMLNRGIMVADINPSQFYAVSNVRLSNSNYWLNRDDGTFSVEGKTFTHWLYIPSCDLLDESVKVDTVERKQLRPDFGQPDPPRATESKVDTGSEMEQLLKNEPINFFLSNVLRYLSIEEMKILTEKLSRRCGLKISDTGSEGVEDDDSHFFEGNETTQN